MNGISPPPSTSGAEVRAPCSAPFPSHPPVSTTLLHLDCFDVVSPQNIARPAVGCDDTDGSPALPSSLPIRDTGSEQRPCVKPTMYWRVNPWRKTEGDEELQFNKWPEEFIAFILCSKSVTPSALSMPICLVYKSKASKHIV